MQVVVVGLIVVVVVGLVIVVVGVVVVVVAGVVVVVAGVVVVVLMLLLVDNVVSNSLILILSRHLSCKARRLFTNGCARRVANVGLIVKNGQGKSNVERNVSYIPTFSGCRRVEKINIF